MEPQTANSTQILEAILNALADKVALRLERRPNGAVSLKSRLLTVEQAAQYLGRSERSVRHLIRSGKLPVVRLDDRIFLDLKDLDRAIEAAKEVAL